MLLGVARRTARDRNSPEWGQSLSRAICQGLDRMPYEVVETEVKTSRMRTPMASEAMILGALRQFDPVVKKTGSLSSTFAHDLPSPRLKTEEPTHTALAESKTAAT